jgi:hypothetical protein
MADIHIGTVNERGDVTVYYHVPVAEALRAHTLLAFGAQTLVAPGSTEAEQASADAGALREVAQRVNLDVHDQNAVNVATARVRANWSVIAAAEAARIANALRWYGVTLARA